MALDIIQKIKESEEKAEKIVSDAHNKAAKTFLDTEDEVKSERKKIQGSYKKRLEESLAVSEKESEKTISEMKEECRSKIEKVRDLAKKNQRKAVEHVLSETGF